MRVLIGHRRDNGTFDRASDHNNFCAHILPCWHCNEDATCDIQRWAGFAWNKTRTQSNSSGRDHEMVEISFGSFSMQIIFVALYHSQVATSHLLVTLVSMWSVCAGVASLFHCVRNSWSAGSSMPICTGYNESLENITAHQSKKVRMVLGWRKVHGCKVWVSSWSLMASQHAHRHQYTVNNWLTMIVCATADRQGQWLRIAH